MTRIDKKKRLSVPPVAVFLAAALASLGLIMLWHFEPDGGVLHTAKSVVRTVSYPFKFAGSAVAYPFQLVAGAADDAGASPEKLSALEQENASLKGELSRLEEYRLENERLNGLLALKSSYDVPSVGARVIAASGSAWSKTVEIDRGGLDGVSAGMAVVGTGGLVGQVEAAGPASSVVRLIVDEGSGVSVMLQRNRATGILNGSIDGSVSLDYVSSEASVEEGDVVITSGMGGVYPKGIVAAVVTRAEKSPEDIYYSIWVRPTAFGALNEEVLVLTAGSAALPGAEGAQSGAADSGAAGAANAGGSANAAGTGGSANAGSGG